MRASVRWSGTGPRVGPASGRGPAGRPSTGLRADPVVAGRHRCHARGCGSTGADRRRSRPLPVAGPPVARRRWLPGRGGGCRRCRRPQRRSRPRPRRRAARRPAPRHRRLRRGGEDRRPAGGADHRPGVEPGAAGLRLPGRRQPGAGVHHQGRAERGGPPAGHLRTGGSPDVQRLSPQGRRVVGAAGLLAGIGAGCALVWGGYEVPADLLAPTLVLEVAVGWSFTTVGVVAWARRPDSRTRALMVVLGFGWFARFVVRSEERRV